MMAIRLPESIDQKRLENARQAPLGAPKEPFTCASHLQHLDETEDGISPSVP